MFSPQLVNDFRFSYSREVSHRGPGSNAANVTASVAIPFQPTPSAIQGVGVQGGFSFGDNPPAFFTRNNYTWANDVSWEMGKHDFHFGGSFERSSVDLNNLSISLAFSALARRTDTCSGVLPLHLSALPRRHPFRRRRRRQWLRAAARRRRVQTTAPTSSASTSGQLPRYPPLTLNLGLRYEPAFP
jgi:hypothetical protein